MNIIAILKTLEREIAEYADAAGKDIEQVAVELRDFIAGKKAEALKANPTPAVPPAAGSTAAGAPDPTTSGPAAA